VDRHAKDRRGTLLAFGVVLIVVGESSASLGVVAAVLVLVNAPPSLRVTASVYAISAQPLLTLGVVAAALICAGIADPACGAGPGRW